MSVCLSVSVCICLSHSLSVPLLTLALSLSLLFVLAFPIMWSFFSHLFHKERKKERVRGLAVQFVGRSRKKGTMLRRRSCNQNIIYNFLKKLKIKKKTISSFHIGKDCAKV